MNLTDKGVMVTQDGIMGDSLLILVVAIYCKFKVSLFTLQTPNYIHLQLLIILAVIKRF